MLWLSLLLACNDSDGAVRVDVTGTITTWDGTPLPFEGAGRARPNRLESTPSIEVRNRKKDETNEWELVFEPPHGQWVSVPTGTYNTGDPLYLEPSAWDGEFWTETVAGADAAWGDGGILSLTRMNDLMPGDRDPEHVMAYVVNISESDEHGFTGDLEARFSNGRLLAVAMTAKGAEAPDAAPVKGADGEWGHCWNETVCVASKYGDAADPDQARADLSASCDIPDDGDVGGYGDGQCPTSNAHSECFDAFGPLESTQEYVEFQVVFYAAACSAYSEADMEGTCSTYSGVYQKRSECP